MMSCLIVDDEPIARAGIEEYLGQVENLTLAGQCRSGLEAQAWLAKNNADLLFLDIEMPLLNGLSLLQNLEHPPLTILTTAYSHYAVESYNYNVVDYLLKPISFERFMQAVTKATQIWDTIQKVNIESDFIFIKCDGNLEKIKLSELLRVEAMGNYCTLYTKDTKYITYGTVKSLKEQLPEELFMQVHKSHIIAINEVSCFKGDKVVLGNQEISVSRRYKQELTLLLSKKLILK